MGEDRSPSPWPGIVGGLVAAVLLLLVVRLVIGVFTALLRLVVIGALVIAGIYVWGRVTRRE